MLPIAVEEPPLVVAAAGCGWTRAAYAAGFVLALGLGFCIWGIPLPVRDFTTFMFEFQQESPWETLVKRTFATNYFRPLFFMQWRLQFDLSNGHYVLAFRGLQAAQLIAIVLLFLRVLKVRTLAGFTAACMALAVMLGLHTIINGLREGPLTAVFACALALNVSFGTRSSWSRDVAATLLLVYAALSVELGVLVWVIYVAAFLVGRRGVSLSGVALSTAVLAAYFVLRFAVLDPGASDMLTRRIDGGAVGGRPIAIYLHNIAASVLSVLFSEPRNGVWEFARRASAGELAPWLWINVVTSTLTTGCLAWYVATQSRAWYGRTVTRKDQLVLVSLAVLAGNATLGFAYTKDVMLSPAGLLYAVAAFVAFEAALTRLPTARVPVRTLGTLALLAVSIGWSIRTVGLGYVLRETAFVRRNEWATGIESLIRDGQLPNDPRAKALVEQFRRDAIHAHIPNPWLAHPWAERYFDRVF